MAGHEEADRGPDLTLGVALSDIPASGLLKGHVGEEAVLLARSGGEFFAVGASCTHYHGPLADGLIEGETVRCPWHHACFSLRTGEALRAPAFDPIGCWSTTQRDGKVFVGAKKAGAKRAPSLPAGVSRIVIVGGGAAGFAAAEMLRRDGFQGSIALLSDDAAPPVDRPNLSKDYLAGSAPEEWVPLRGEDWYRDNGIDLALGTKVSAIDARAGEVELAGGARKPYDRLLIATGAEPVRLDIPGASAPHVHTLRTLADCRAIIAGAEAAQKIVVIGASFIGLEAAAALRARSKNVAVVAPEARPLERVFGPELGDFVRALHEEHGVEFHLQEGVVAIEAKRVILKSGASLPADLVVVGVGVRPRTALAEKLGLKVDRGVVVDEFLRTSAENILAAGDIARWPDKASGESLRIEHWVVAERQGQTAARNMLGMQERFEDVPFFWSKHYDLPINYVGHAAAWDRLEIEGDIGKRDCAVRYWKDGRLRAVASIYRDVDSLKAEVALGAA
jgi:NADPH-dependent 2,4-dienoyl-CoA reductase/sulfur reductase-like enzyme/nitrite reductase/ring-hydroxylating ferredoxin subunit